MDMMNKSKIRISSSDNALVEGFNWAKTQALHYVHDNDTAAGLWYEAALPGRDAFCMRDVSHQSAGAQALGLAAHTKNMLRKFAMNISGSKDWCSYWEIDKDDRPAPVDYKNDNDFWYNLPANFDIMDCCYRQYQWTGDPDYIKDAVFRNFYKRTVDDFVNRWGINNLGFVEQRGKCGYRGIPSYLESQHYLGEILGASDFVAAQYAGFKAYSKMLRLAGDNENSCFYHNKSAQLKEMFNSNWWDEEMNNYYTYVLADGSFSGMSASNVAENSSRVTSLPLYFGITDRGCKTRAAIADLLKYENINVESKSHYAETLYKYGYNNEAYQILMELTDPRLSRREYPEVSFSVVGSILTGMMGISPDAAGRRIETTHGLSSQTEWVTIENIPVFDNQISVSHVQNKGTVFTNLSGAQVRWRAAFDIEVEELIVDGVRIATQKASREDGRLYSYVEIEVKENERYEVMVP